MTREHENNCNVISECEETSEIVSIATILVILA